MDYAISNKISFSHLFIKSWDATREVLSYPPAAGLLAVYRISTLIEHIDFAIQNVSNYSFISSILFYVFL